MENEWYVGLEGNGGRLEVEGDSFLSVCLLACLLLCLLLQARGWAASCSFCALFCGFFLFFPLATCVCVCVRVPFPFPPSLCGWIRDRLVMVMVILRVVFFKLIDNEDLFISFRVLGMDIHKYII